jgi:hypothetical protein
MCFSAAGSFALSGVLTLLGATSMARNSSKPHRMFAAIPLLFAAQQAAEGMVWVTLDGGHPLLNRLGISAFLGIALVVWPVWVPLAFRLLEGEPRRRRALGLLLCAGGLVASATFLLIVRFPPFAQIRGHSINYEYAGSDDAPKRLLYLLAYVIPTVVPFFVSTLRMARLLGVVLVFSLVAATIVQRDALTSVWCFFAALLSGLILIALEREQRAAFAPPIRQN